MTPPSTIKYLVPTLIALIMFTLATPCTAAENPPPLVLVSVPWRNAQTLEKIYRPMIRLLEQQMGRSVVFYVSTDYRELGQRLISGAAHLGIFGPNAYVEAKNQYPAIRYLATCMQPSAYYRSLIIARKDSGIRRLSDLKGKSFGFTDKQSTSGYLYPLLMLTAAGLDPKTDFSITYFLEKHDKVFDAVAGKSIDAGGASLTAMAQARERNHDVYTIVAQSDPIPRNAVAAAPNLSDDEILRIKQILSTAGDSEIFQKSDSILTGFALETDQFYDIVRKARTLRHRTAP